MVGDGADRLTDPVAVAGPPLKRLENKEIERALEELDAVLMARCGHK